MYTILDLLSGNDGRGLLVRGQVGLLGEIGCCVRIALHSEIIQDQGIDITVEIVSNC